MNHSPFDFGDNAPPADLNLNYATIDTPSPHSTGSASSSTTHQDFLPFAPSASPGLTPTDDADDDDTDEDNSGQPVLFSDPRRWDANDIQAWLRWQGRQCKIKPKLEAAQFPSQGSDLVQMSRADFVISAGSRSGGRFLALFLGDRMRLETGQCSQLSLDEEPGMSFLF